MTFAKAQVGRRLNMEQVTTCTYSHRSTRGQCRAGHQRSGRQRPSGSTPNRVRRHLDGHGRNWKYSACVARSDRRPIEKCSGRSKASTACGDRRGDKTRKAGLRQGPARLNRPSIFVYGAQLCLAIKKENQWESVGVEAGANHAAGRVSEKRFTLWKFSRLGGRVPFRAPVQRGKYTANTMDSAVDGKRWDEACQKVAASRDSRMKNERIAKRGPGRLEFDQEGSTPSDI